MGSQTQPIAGAAPQVPVQTEEQKAFSMLDTILSESQRISRDRLLVQRAELEIKQRFARAFAASGCFADIKGASESEAIARALVKIELGEAMGFTPAESMTGIDIIQGRVAIGASLRAARMAAAGYSWPQMVLTNEGCWLPLYFKGQPMLAPKVNKDTGEIVNGPDGTPVMEQVVVAFTKADAEKAQVATKDNYRKNPRNMYFSRAITNAQRWYAPHVLKLDVLSTEEAQDEAPAAPPTEPMRAAISLDAFKPSADSNRGHDATAPVDAAPQTVGQQPDGTFNAGESLFPEGGKRKK